MNESLKAVDEFLTKALHRFEAAGHIVGEIGFEPDVALGVSGELYRSAEKYIIDAHRILKGLHGEGGG